MARLKKPPADVVRAIPPELYHGIDRRGFDVLSNDPVVHERCSRTRREWMADVRAAGFTVLEVRRAAETDTGYREWRAAQHRRRSLP